jgi:3-deoxy-7-phosphoheptulonate synthase
MILVLKKEATQNEIKHVVNEISKLGFTAHTIKGETKSVIGIIGNSDKSKLTALKTYSFVDSLVAVSKPYKLAARSSKEESTIINVDGIQIGKNSFFIIGGPCSVENKEQILKSATIVANNNAHMLRGGAYKPRTSPYSFQGLEEEGLKLLAEAKKKTNLPIVTELLSASNIDLVDKYADIIQIGARNMQNFSLLKELGKTKKPIILKRGLSATIDEFLMSAEYIMSVGNYNIILCERGIRTFETAYRNTLDLNAIPTLKKLTHLPVIVDPSHGTGKTELVIPMSKAAIAAGADGLMIEMHPNPVEAFSDGPQSLNPDEFKTLMKEITPFIKVAGKTLS